MENSINFLFCFLKPSKTPEQHVVHCSCSCHTNIFEALANNQYRKQAGAELGQAQLKLGLDCTLIFFRFGSIVLVELN